MSLFVFADNASSYLASGIASGDTTLTVLAGKGALFPSISAGHIAAITVEDASGNIEVMYATARSGDTLTVTRAQEGTSAQAFASGSIVEQRFTSGTLAAMLQKNGGDTLAGTTTVSGVLALGAGGSIQGGEIAGTAIRSQPGDTSNQILVPIGGAPTIGGSVILTAADIANNMPAGTGLILTNMIVMWAGLSSAIPAGWHLCDGTNGTPDLRDQFIVGGGGSFATSGTYSAATGSTAPAGGTTGTYQLTLADIPSHVHPFDYFFGAGTAVIGIPGFATPANYITQTPGAGTRNSFAGTPNTGAGTNAHSHTFTGAAHTHTQSIPYRAVFAIMKL